LFALREFISLLPTRRGDYFPLLIAFYFVIPYQYYLIYTDWYGLYSIFIPLYVFLLIPIASLKQEDTTHFLERSSKIQWGLMVSVFCISHVPALLNLKLPEFKGEPIWLAIWLIMVVQASDVLQYVCGKLFGKHKVAPVLSPSKTVEGLLGGIFLATALGTAMAWLTPFSYVQAACIGLVVCIFGFFGGLVMSAIKRDRGVKDWGQLIHGHGGMLDRIDSICFSAPIFFHILRYWWS
jgi:phosphatidate cytidylyltransferase